MLVVDYVSPHSQNGHILGVAALNIYQINQRIDSYVGRTSVPICFRHHTMDIKWE